MYNLIIHFGVFVLFQVQLEARDRELNAFKLILKQSLILNQTNSLNHQLVTTGAAAGGVSAGGGGPRTPVMMNHTNFNLLSPNETGVGANDLVTHLLAGAVLGGNNDHLMSAMAPPPNSMVSNNSNPVVLNPAKSMNNSLLISTNGQTTINSSTALSTATTAVTTASTSAVGEGMLVSDSGSQNGSNTAFTNSKQKMDDSNSAIN